MDDILEHNELKTLWRKYNEVRLSGDKKTANQLLTDFIELLKQQDKDSIKAFADKTCNLALDSSIIIANNGEEVSGQRVRIQHQLFKQVIVPVLTDQYIKDSAVHVKWIGQLEQFFYSDNKTTKNFLSAIGAEFPFDTVFFLERSYSLSADQKTIGLLLKRMSQDISYAIHEVPLGVLYEPDTFDQMVSKFRDYWEQSGNKEIWRDRLEEWTLIGEHWRKYLDTKDDFDNFEHYLTQKEIKIE